MSKYFPRRGRGTTPLISQSLVVITIASLPTQSARGEGHAVIGRPKAGVQVGGGPTSGDRVRCYAFPGGPEAVALDTLITCMVSVYHRDASVLSYPRSTYSYVYRILLFIWICLMVILIFMFMCIYLLVILLWWIVYIVLVWLSLGVMRRRLIFSY